jgi:hypothetical protein
VMISWNKQQRRQLCCPFPLLNVFIMSYSRSRLSNFCTCRAAFFTQCVKDECRRLSRPSNWKEFNARMGTYFMQRFLLILYCCKIGSVVFVLL